MKRKVILVTALTIVLASCGNNTNSANSGTDSTSVNATRDSMSSMPGSSTPGTGSMGATGTTGTGTVADSGNAAHPGSDTMHANSTMKDSSMRK